MDPTWANCGTCNCRDGVAPHPRWEIKGVLKTSTCPRRLTDEDSFEWIALYSHYQSGHLLNAGGISDQPAAYLEAMKLIANWVAQERDNAKS